MAQPILQHRVQTAAPNEHADAILAACQLLQELQDQGVLDLLRGLAGSGGEIVTKLSEAANSPESIAAMRNIVSMLRILGSIDPEILHDVAEIAAKPAKPRRELWKAVRAVEAAAHGLRVFGRVFMARQLH